MGLVIASEFYVARMAEYFYYEQLYARREKQLLWANPSSEYYNKAIPTQALPFKRLPFMVESVFL